MKTKFMQTKIFDMSQLQNNLSRIAAAQYLGGICLSTLDKLQIPKVQIRRRVFYRLTDLEKWLTDHTVKPEADQ
jgi:hypothetical protein